ncbi:MAG: hypothetical protein AMXMBFR82_31330 [Candidatus Hydrogenedentota bacterium]
MSTGVGERALENLRTVRVLHPMMLSLTPLLGLYAQNASVTPLHVLVRPAMVLTVCAAMLWILCWVLLRDRYRAGFVASALVLAFIVLWGVLEDAIAAVVPLLSSWSPSTFYVAYAGLVLLGIGGYLYRYRKSKRAMGNFALVMVPVALVGLVVATFLLAPVFGRRAAWIITVYLVITCFVVYGVLRSRSDYRALTPSANWFAGILIALYCGVVLFNRTPVPEVEIVPMDITPAVEKDAELPDIYVICLDGYARSDVLRTTYGFNNMAFESALRNLGFEIAQDSISNYTVPAFSLTGCLNLDYLDDLVVAADRAEGTVDNVLDLYHSNRVFSFLRSQGYRIIALSPGVQSLELDEPAVDARLEPPRSPGEFEMVLAGRTVASRVMESVYFLQYRNPAYWHYAFRRTRILHAVDALKRIRGEKSEQPRFVFANLLVPEPPYLFTRDGGRAQPFGPGSLSVQRGMRGEDAEFREAYLDQLFFTNRIVTEIAEVVAGQSSRPCAVLVFSSRGAPLSLQPSDAGVDRRYANLIAARFPQPANGDNDVVYPSLSLVNVFRVAFNRLFDTGLPLLDDEMKVTDDDAPFASTSVAR